MIGSSRESLAACQEGLDARRQDAGFPQLADELFAVASLLDNEGQLRQTLADPGQPASVRDGLVRQIFGSRVSGLAVDVLLMVTGKRWSSDADMLSAIEMLGDQAAFTVAEADGSLDATEEELFLFGRALDSSSALQMALTDPAQSSATKGAIETIRQRQAADERMAREAVEKAQENSNLLNRTVLTIPQQAGGDGRLFGSVTAQDIATAIREARGLRIDKKNVHLPEPIKSVGTYMVVVEVVENVTATIKTMVVAKK